MKSGDIVYLRKDVEKLTSWAKLSIHREDLKPDVPYKISVIGTSCFGHDIVVPCIGTFDTCGWKDKEWFITEAEYLAQEGKSKKSEFVVGKWYKNIGVSKEYIGKFLEIRNGNFVCDGYIYNGVYADSYNTGLSNKFKDAIECSLEEIQQYLPEGHIDKFPVKEKKWLPKVGDWITTNMFNNPVSTNLYTVKVLQDTTDKHTFEFSFRTTTQTDPLGLTEVEAAVYPIHYHVKPIIRPSTPDEIASVTKPKDEINQDKVCDLCTKVFYDGCVNSGPHNLCEGRHCEPATEMYLEEQEENKPKVIQTSTPIGTTTICEDLMREDDKPFTPKECKEPTEQELIDEAIRRGFVEGAGYIGVTGTNRVNIISDKDLLDGAEVYGKGKIGIYGHSGYIYYKDQWATIVKPASETINIPIDGLKVHDRTMTRVDLLSAMVNLEKMDVYNKANQQEEQPILISKVKTSNKIIVL